MKPWYGCIGTHIISRSSSQGGGQIGTQQRTLDRKHGNGRPVLWALLSAKGWVGRLAFSTTAAANPRVCTGQLSCACRPGMMPTSTSHWRECRQSLAWSWTGWAHQNLATFDSLRHSQAGARLSSMCAKSTTRRRLANGNLRNVFRNSTASGV